MSIHLPEELVAIDRRMRDRIAPWITRGVALAGAKIDDARAHAEKAVTDAARAAADGRPTLGVVKRSRSYLAAVARLDELTEALAGPGPTSLAGLVRDARAACYRDSVAIWRAVVDPSLWRSPDPQATKAGLARARRQLVNGAELYDWIDESTRRAIAELTRAVTLASASIADRGHRFDALDSWEETKRSVLGSLVMTTLSDSDQRSHTLAAVDILALDRLDPLVSAILGD